MSGAGGGLGASRGSASASSGSGSGSACAAAGAGGSIGVRATRARSDINGSRCALGTVSANAVLVVDDCLGWEYTRVSLALHLATGIESSGHADAGAGSGVGLDNGVVGVVVGPVDSVAGGNVEHLRRERTVDDGDIPGLCEN